MKLFLLTLTCILSTILVGTWAKATTFAPAPLGQTIHESPIIVSGTIISVAVKNDVTLSGNLLPFTYYQFNVTEVLKGSLSANSIVIRQMGGGNLRASGAASFSINENVIVLLDTRNPDGSYDVHGLSLGKIRMDSLSGNLSGTAIESDKQHALFTKTAPKDHWSMNDLRSLIQNDKH